METRSFLVILSLMQIQEVAGDQPESRPRHLPEQTMRIERCSDPSCATLVSPLRAHALSRQLQVSSLAFPLGLA